MKFFVGKYKNIPTSWNSPHDAFNLSKLKLVFQTVLFEACFISNANIILESQNVDNK